MFPVALLTLLLVLSITGSPIQAADPPISVPITSGLKFSNGTYNPVAHDRARLQALRDRSKHEKRLINVPLIYDGYRGCTIPVDIGNPPTRYNLLLDSGSANTWVRNSVYVPTDTSTPTQRPVELTYEGGSIEGFEFLDTVTVGPGLTVIRQSIGVADEVEGLHNYDGFLGIGPVALTLGSLPETPTVPIPTVTNNLHSQNTISADVLGLFFQPYSGSLEEPGGQLTFGRSDPTLHHGDVAYTPITNIDPASKSWGIEQSITYGNTEILRTTTGIVDCGNSLIGIASEAFELYKAATGGEYDAVTELLVISDDEYSALRPLKFNIRGGRTYTLTPNGQIWPRSLNTRIDGEVGSIYLIVSDLGEEIGEGDFDFINGFAFMQRFYTVLDATNRQVGFATTPFTDATTN